MKSIVNKWRKWCTIIVTLPRTGHPPKIDKRTISEAVTRPTATIKEQKGILASPGHFMGITSKKTCFVQNQDSHTALTMKHGGGSIVLWGGSSSAGTEA